MADITIYLTMFSSCIVGFVLGLAFIILVGLRIRYDTKKSNAASIFSADRENNAKN